MYIQYKLVWSRFAAAPSTLSAGVFEVRASFLVQPDAFILLLVGVERLEEFCFGDSLVFHLEANPDIGAHDKLLLALINQVDLYGDSILLIQVLIELLSKLEVSYDVVAALNMRTPHIAYLIIGCTEQFVIAITAIISELEWKFVREVAKV